MPGQRMARRSGRARSARRSIVAVGKDRIANCHGVLLSALREQDLHSVDRLSGGAQGNVCRGPVPSWMRLVTSARRADSVHGRNGNTRKGETGVAGPRAGDRCSSASSPKVESSQDFFGERRPVGGESHSVERYNDRLCPNGLARIIHTHACNGFFVHHSSGGASAG
jgi:hypothetical protein